MIFFRTDGQAALNTLFVAAQETLHQYRDAVELVEVSLGQVFANISQQRQEFIRRLEHAVRESGDLPTVPDPDKEAGEMLFHHVAALIKTHYAGDIIQQRIDAEKKLAELLIDTQRTELEAQHATLLDELALHISATITLLQSLYTHVIAEQE